MNKFIFIVLLAASLGSEACQTWTPFPKEGSNKIDVDFSVSDLVFHGYLARSESTKLRGNESEGSRVYRFVVIESFKGNVDVGESIDVVQRSGWCNFRYMFDNNYFVYLNVNSDGQYAFSTARTIPTSPISLDLNNEDDKAYYESLIQRGSADDFKVAMTRKDGSPRHVVKSIDKQLQLMRSKMLNKARQE